MQFCERLRNAKSNIPEHVNGEEIYKKWVAPAVITAGKVTGHYAVSGLFETYGDQTRIYCYHVTREEYSVETEGRMRLAVGRAHVKSEITWGERRFGFAVLHLGDHNITGGVREIGDEAPFYQLRDRLKQAFAQADTAEVIRILDEHFHDSTFSIRSLFRDEQRRIINLILQDSLSSSTASIRSMYEHQAPLLRFLSALNVPIPGAFQSVAGIALNGQLQQALERPEIDGAAVQALLREAQLNHVKLDATTLEFTMRRRLEAQAAVFREKAGRLGCAEAAPRIAEYRRRIAVPRGPRDRAGAQLRAPGARRNERQPKRHGRSDRQRPRERRRRRSAGDAANLRSCPPGMEPRAFRRPRKALYPGNSVMRSRVPLATYRLQFNSNSRWEIRDEGSGAA